MGNKMVKTKFLSSIVIFGTIGIVSRFIPLCSSGIVFYRALLACLFLSIVTIVTKRKVYFNKIKKNLFPLVLAGAVMGFNWVFQFEAFNIASVSVGTTCYNTMPVFLILLTPLMFKQKQSIKNIVCVFVAMLGIVFVSNVFFTGIKSTEILGCLYGILGGFLYALGVLITKKVTDVDSYDKIIIEFFVSTLVMIPYIIFNKDGSFTFYEGISTSEFIVGIIAMSSLGIIHTGIAYILYYSSIDYIPNDEMAVYTYIDPVVALVLSFLILGERMNILQIVGAVLILSSTFIANVKLKKKTNV